MTPFRTYPDPFSGLGTCPAMTPCSGPVPVLALTAAQSCPDTWLRRMELTRFRFLPRPCTGPGSGSGPIPALTQAMALISSLPQVPEDPGSIPGHVSALAPGLGPDPFSVMTPGSGPTRPCPDAGSGPDHSHVRIQAQGPALFLHSPRFSSQPSLCSDPSSSPNPILVLA